MKIGSYSKMFKSLTQTYKVFFVKPALEHMIDLVTFSQKTKYFRVITILDNN